MAKQTIFRIRKKLTIIETGDNLKPEKSFGYSIAFR